MAETIESTTRDRDPAPPREENDGSYKANDGNEHGSRGLPTPLTLVSALALVVALLFLAAFLFWTSPTDTDRYLGPHDPATLGD